MAVVTLYNCDCDEVTAVAESNVEYGYTYHIKATPVNLPADQPEGVEINDSRLNGKIVTKVATALQVFTPDLFTKNRLYGKIIMLNFQFYDGLDVVVTWQWP